MCKVKKIYPLWGFLLSFPLWMVSCVDNKYVWGTERNVY